MSRKSKGKVSVSGPLDPDISRSKWHSWNTLKDSCVLASVADMEMTLFSESTKLFSKLRTRTQVLKVRDPLLSSHVSGQPIKKKRKGKEE